MKRRTGKFNHGKRPYDRRHQKTRQLKASVDKNRKGFGFLIFDNDKIDDVFVSPREAGGLFHGDRVEVELSSDNEVISIKVIEHRFKEIFGRYRPAPKRPGSPRGGWITYERKQTSEEVFIPAPPSDVAATDWVRAKLTFHDTGTYRVTGHITDVYGTELPASADLAMIASEHNLTEEHSRAAEEEAAQVSKPIDFQHELKSLNRVDLRNVPFITIDGETARDFDDAIFVEREKSGYILWVGIADVSHYVKENTSLDKDARGRGTSVYFPEKAFHMLPRVLSENLCSLRPNEPRLSLVAKMNFDYSGKRTKIEILEALIESRRRATYNEIQKEWLQNKKNKSWEYYPHFELFKIMRGQRSKRGSIDFDLYEGEIRVDQTGEPISIKKAERLDSHRLIEEFMIAANEAVTEWIMERKWPFIYRVHDEPTEEALTKFEELAKTVGVSVVINPGNIQEVLSDLVRRLSGHPASALLNMSLLRSMKKAVYSSVHGQHFGLASAAYTHFTSPIRRYPDLVVHRLLKLALANDKRNRAALEKELAEIALHSSYRERLADEAERESNKLKEVRLMKKHLGETFPGRVVGMIEAGMFIQIEDPYVEGFLSQEALTEDYFQFHEKRMVFVGNRSKKIIKIGDCFDVTVVRADLDRRQIGFQKGYDESKLD